MTHILVREFWKGDVVEHRFENLELTVRWLIRKHAINQAMGAMVSFRVFNVDKNGATKLVSGVLLQSTIDYVMDLLKAEELEN